MWEDFVNFILFFFSNQIWWRVGEVQSMFLLSSWNHTAGVHSEKLELEQSKYDIPGVHSEKLKNALTVEL